MSLNIPLMISGWRVDRSYNGSDHNTINFSLGREKIVEEAHRPWYKADWGVFQELLRNEVFNIPVNITDKKLDKMLGIFYRKIKKALDKACPMTGRHTRDANNEWFNEQIEELREKTRSEYGKLRRGNNREAFKRAQKKYKTTCCRAKRKHWRKFLANTPDE